jgi:hypothetical protein
MKGEVVALRDQNFIEFSFQLWAEMKIPFQLYAEMNFPFQLYAEMKIPFQLVISISAGWRARRCACVRAWASPTGSAGSTYVYLYGFCMVNWPARATINSSFGRANSFQRIDSISALS